MNVLEALVDRVVSLQTELRRSPRFEWGTVTAASPLAVVLDGDTEPLDGSPSTLVGGLQVGRRVYVVIQNRRATIVGAAPA